MDGTMGYAKLPIRLADHPICYPVHNHSSFFVPFLFDGTPSISWSKFLWLQKKWRWSDHLLRHPLTGSRRPILHPDPTWRPASWYDLIWSTIECPTDLASEELTVSQFRSIFLSRCNFFWHNDDVRCFVFFFLKSFGWKNPEIAKLFGWWTWQNPSKGSLLKGWRQLATSVVSKKHGGGCIFQGYWMIFGISKSIWLVFHHPHLKLRPFARCSREKPSSRRLVYLVCWSPKHSVCCHDCNLGPNPITGSTVDSMKVSKDPLIWIVIIIFLYRYNGVWRFSPNLQLVEKSKKLGFRVPNTSKPKVFGGFWTTRVTITTTSLIDKKKPCKKLSLDDSEDSWFWETGNLGFHLCKRPFHIEIRMVCIQTKMIHRFLPWQLCDRDLLGMVKREPFKRCWVLQLQ